MTKKITFAVTNDFVLALPAGKVFTQKLKDELGLRGFHLLDVFDIVFCFGEALFSNGDGFVFLVVDLIAINAKVQI